MKFAFRSPFLLGLAVSVLLVPVAGAQPFKKRKLSPPPSPSPAPAQVAVPVANPFLHPGSVSTPIPPASLPATVVSPAPVAPAPVAPYALPYSGYRYERKPDSRGGLFKSKAPSEEMLELLAVIRKRAEAISSFGLPYVFGGDHPKEGGLDCSGAMKFLLSDIGFRDMPRTSYEQYAWLKKARTLRHSRTIPANMGGKKGLKPGDLIFWGGTYDSGHKVSHVMIYLGQGKDGTHYMFGARGKKKTGLNGSGVDIYKLEAGHQKGLIGYGSLPGVS